MKKFILSLAAVLAAGVAAPALAIIPMDWQFHARPYPVLSADEGSAEPFTLDCRSSPGVPLRVSTVVNMHQPPRQAPTVAVMIISGHARITQTATGHWSADTQGMRFTVTVPLASPLLSEYARTGELSVRAMGDIDVYPIAPRALARRFVAACRAR
jgi:hypothetical protein